MLLVDISILIASLIVLIVSGTYLVKSLTKISIFLNLTGFAVSFIIMAFATSIPELFVGINAALAKNTALALGNVIGANIANLTLVIGIPIILAKGIKLESRKIYKDTLYMALISILPLILILIGKQLSRIDAIILIAVFLFYNWRIYKQQKEFSKKINGKIKHYEVVLYSFLFIFCLALLFISADNLVQYASTLSLNLGFPPILIGLFFVAIGTTLPELIFGTRAAMMKQPQLAIGNIIGSVITNSTLVLAVTALIYPVTANLTLFFISVAFLILVTFLFATFADSGNEFSWKEGTALILLYVFFLFVEFYIVMVS